MNSSADYQLLVEQAMQVGGRAHMRPVVSKELLHYDILFSLDREGILDELTFQGGTSLRLCYGSARFSEDLDFAGGKQFSSATLQSLKLCIEKYIGDRYGLEVTVKNPKELRDDPTYRDLNIDKWLVSIITSSGRPDIPKQRIKIEIANVDAHTKEPKALLSNYSFLPDGYEDTLVMVETLEEIMADKLISLVTTSKYVRHRDIWDLRWLKQQGAEVSKELVAKKIEDYRISDYQLKLETMITRLPAIIEGASLRNELKRFLPTEVQERTLEKPKFLLFLKNEVSELLMQCRE